ncbi:hypothetical protein WMF45_19875 [Sorangium sp. So ce448]|uniref:hypothetical protein n=1 Tax=Sorangium sp. So ce448 TaxID=3133314 RepID=UPI003F5E0554
MFRQLNETDNAGRIRTVQLVGPMLRNAPFGLLYAEVRFLASEFAQRLPASRFRPR